MRVKQFWSLLFPAPNTPAGIIYGYTGRLAATEPEAGGKLRANDWSRYMGIVRPALDAGAPSILRVHGQASGTTYSNGYIFRGADGSLNWYYEALGGEPGPLCSAGRRACCAAGVGTPMDARRRRHASRPRTRCSRCSPPPPAPRAGMETGVTDPKGDTKSTWMWGPQRAFVSRAAKTSETLDQVVAALKGELPLRSVTIDGSVVTKD